jgi:uncharacterized protein YacL
MGLFWFKQRSGVSSQRDSGSPGVVGLRGAGASFRQGFHQRWTFWAFRLIPIILSGQLSYRLAPLGLHGLLAAALGACAAIVILIAEWRMRGAGARSLAGGTVGGLIGLFASLLITLVVSRAVEMETTRAFLEFTSLFGLGYLGIVVGASKAQDLLIVPLPESPASSNRDVVPMKLLDTSALIDGRIADICETHFLDGSLGVPQFVLHELQLVADSPDTLKRQRGRRGLEMLQRMQKMPGLQVRILQEELPGTTTVDQKLLELARETGSKIVTTDFNLNKVARVQGIAVLNVNELANAMKPEVLPGESMRVLILREGKESTQGVAYLEDGTMVVVDGARRFINRTIDIVVTSMHQTPAGKMIFGRMDDRVEVAPANATGSGHVPRSGTRFGGGSSTAYSGSEPQ